MDATNRIPDTEPTTELIDSLKGLARSRAKLDKLKADKKRLVEEFEKSDEFLYLLAEISAQEDMCGMFDTNVRKLAVKSLSLPKGVTVKTFKEAVIRDAEKARLWCFENFKPAMKVDEKVLKDAIKKDLVPSEIGAVIEEKRAQIATDLSDYLE